MSGLKNEQFFFPTRTSYKYSLRNELILDDKMRKPSIKFGDDCLISIDTATL